MRLNWRNLQEEEQDMFFQMRKKYKDYDKVDFLIHKTLKSLGVPLEDFIKRNEKSQTIIE